MNEPGLTIRIDTRSGRICVHKHTLQAIGSPEFIRIGYEPGSKSLMVLGTWSGGEKGVRVSFDSGGSFYFRCKGLVEGIQKVGNVLQEPGSYRIRGKLSAREPAASFPLCEAIRITGQENDTAHTAVLPDEPV